MRTIIFAAVFGLICALSLTLAGRLAAPYRTANEKAEEMRNYLSALGIPFEPKASANTLIDIFSRNVRVMTNDTLVLYERVSETNLTGDPIAVAVPIHGMGLWGPIHGVLALEPDLKTVRGLRFYRQEETPGLGGEIDKPDFIDRFVGKTIVSGKGDPDFRVVRKGAPLDNNSVDGITGATMTCDRVQDILRNAAVQVAAERSRRHGGNR